MTSSEILLKQITDGEDGDDLVSMALDAIREDEGVSLLTAVMHVASARTAGRNARELAEAAKHLAKDSPIAEALSQAIAAECLNVPPGASLTIITEEGDHWPRAVDTSLMCDAKWVRMFHVSVGARWVKSVASHLLLEHEIPTARQSATRRPR